MGKGLSPEQVQFVTWLTLDRQARRSLGYPIHETEYAEWIGKSTRTLRRWKDKEEFQALLDQRTQQMALSAGRVIEPSDKDAPKAHAHKDPRVTEDFEPPPLPETDTSSVGREQFEEIRDILAQEAKGGDTNAAGTWMRLFGQTYVDMEREELTGNFGHLTDDELIERTLEMVGEPRVARWLKGKLGARGQ